MGILNVERKDQVTVVHLEGSLAGTEVRDIEPRFNEVALVPGLRLVVDLSNVIILNTPAITLFIGAVMFQRPHGGKVVFTGTEGTIDRLLRVCRLDTVMCVVKDLPGAIAEAAR